MLRFLILIAVLFAVAFGFHWLKGMSGEVAVTIGDTVYATDVTIALIALVAAALVAMGLIWFVRELVRSPWRFAQGWRRRARERGRAAIAQGLIAIAAGDLRAAERAVLEASRRAADQPLTRLLQAQTAQLKGDRAAARVVFQAMTEDPATRIAGLRGLYIEAEREGVEEAAHQIAARARAEAPSASWAARALLRHQTAARDWNGALGTLSGATDGRILDKRAARRLRAVILTAKALDKEDAEPEAARQAALEAHDLAPDLVPAAVVAGRLLSRQGDIRRAARVLEGAWKAGPHPEVGEAYVHVRAGDATSDRLERAETLFRIRPHADEGRHAVARAAIDARDFARARQVLAPILTARPTQKALFLMAELEEAETRDRGRAGEWLARAVHAPRDSAWTADGVVLEEWAPVSPVTGRLDAVEWKVPVAEIERPRLEIDAAELTPVAAPALEHGDAAQDADTEADASSAVASPATRADIRSSAAVAAEDSSPTGAMPPPRGNGARQDVREEEQGSGPVVAPAERSLPTETAEAGTAGREPAKPIIPDDPGVGSEEEEDERRFRAF